MPTLDQVNIFKESAAAATAVIFALAFLFMLRLYVRQNKEQRLEVRELHRERIEAGAKQVTELNRIITAALTPKSRRHREEAPDDSKGGAETGGGATP